MSERERGPRAACDHYAPTLAMLDDLPEASDAADPSVSAARRAARAHLAGCAQCQADQRAYARLDGHLRRAFGPAVAAPMRAADLLASIGATHEPIAPASAATRPTRATIRSVIYLGDFNGGFDRMSEHHEREGDMGDNVTPPRKMAPIPSLRPGPGERAAGRQRWAVGCGATAAAVALVVVVATLFATHARPVATQTAHTAVTQTAGAQSHVSGASLGAVAAVSLDSPTDGWALGQASGQQPGSVQTSIAGFYHYDGSQWTL
ncbi:MAG TPA: hypothetical protein VIC27_14545, partial [Ktedonobacterales bacterium]